MWTTLGKNLQHNIHNFREKRQEINLISFALMQVKFTKMPCITFCWHEITNVTICYTYSKFSNFSLQFLATSKIHQEHFDFVKYFPCWIVRTPRNPVHFYLSERCIYNFFQEHLKDSIKHARFDIWFLFLTKTHTKLYTIQQETMYNKDSSLYIVFAYLCIYII